MNRSQVISTIRRVLDDDGRVVLGYLFGSLCKGETGPLSDIDIGVLFRCDVDQRRAHGELMDGLCRALRSDRVDLILLDESPPPLLYRIARDGMLLHCADERARERFVSNAVMHYLDFKPLRDKAFLAAREVILGVR
jgi:predicted nucleotidyltransferase